MSTMDAFFKMMLSTQVLSISTTMASAETSIAWLM